MGHRWGRQASRADSISHRYPGRQNGRASLRRGLLIERLSLVAVVDRQSFTRAARVLHLSQSTVSQHIMLLERRVGGELLAREPGGVRLPPFPAAPAERPLGR